MLQVITVLKIQVSSKVIVSKVELCKIKISISDFLTFSTLQVNSEKVKPGSRAPAGAFVPGKLTFLEF